MLLATAPEVRLARPEDAASIAACFVEAYSGTYPLEDFTRPALLAARLASRRTVFAVAVEAGAVVAAVALEPQDTTGDFGHGVVRRSHRGAGLFAQLHRPLLRQARALGLATVHSQCVTSHVQSQKPMTGLGGRIAGLSLAAAPQSLRFAGLRDQLPQRESFLDYGFALVPRPSAAVYVPASLRRLITTTYDSLGLRCRFARARRSNDALQVTAKHRDELGTVALVFGERGLPFAQVEAILEQTGSADCVFAQLPLASSATPEAADALRRLGFSFAGVLPGRATDGRDALALQRPRELVAPEPIETATSEGEHMKNLVFQDLASVRGLVLA